MWQNCVWWGTQSCTDPGSCSQETHNSKGEVSPEKMLSMAACLHEGCNWGDGETSAWLHASMRVLTGAMGRHLGGGEAGLSMESVGRVLMCHHGWEGRGAEIISETGVIRWHREVKPYIENMCKDVSFWQAVMGRGCEDPVSREHPQLGQARWW